MDLEAGYRNALELTRRMGAAAASQDWDALARIESERSRLIVTLGKTPPPASPSAAARIAELIREIERESAEILERAQRWQEDVRILLRLKA